MVTDLHRANAARYYGKPESEVTPEERYEQKTKRDFTTLYGKSGNAATLERNSCPEK